MSDAELAGCRAWVTGASGGLGREISLGLARLGADVAITGRTPENLEKLAAEIRELGRQALVLPASVSSEQDVAAVEAELRTTWNGLDLLVNCAGVSPTLARAEQLSYVEWQHIVDVNLGGTFLCATAAARLMFDDGGGSIVNVSSIHGRAGISRLAAYSATKGAVDALTRTLSLEWVEQGIRVNAVSPGYFETDMTEHVRNHDRHRSHLLSKIPMGRFGRPAEIVSAVAYLATASYVTGSVVVVDGGWTAA